MRSAARQPLPEPPSADVHGARADVPGRAVDTAVAPADSSSAHARHGAPPTSLQVAALRFVVAGGANAAGTFLLFRLLLRAAGERRGAAAAAQALAYGTGVAVSYVVNRRWTFGSSSAHQRTAFRFVAAHCGSLLLSVSIIQVGLSSARLSASVWWVLATGVTTIVNFVVQRFWVFTRVRDPEHG